MWILSSRNFHDQFETDAILQTDTYSSSQYSCIPAKVFFIQPLVWSGVVRKTAYSKLDLRYMASGGARWRG